MSAAGPIACPTVVPSTRPSSGMSASKAAKARMSGNATFLVVPAAARVITTLALSRPSATPSAMTGIMAGASPSPSPAVWVRLVGVTDGGVRSRVDVDGTAGALDHVLARDCRTERVLRPSSSWHRGSCPEAQAGGGVERVEGHPAVRRVGGGHEHDVVDDRRRAQRRLVDVEVDRWRHGRVPDDTRRVWGSRRPCVVQVLLVERPNERRLRPVTGSKVAAETDVDDPEAAMDRGSRHDAPCILLGSGPRCGHASYRGASVTGVAGAIGPHQELATLGSAP